MNIQYLKSGINDSFRLAEISCFRMSLEVSSTIFSYNFRRTLCLA